MVKNMKKFIKILLIVLILMLLMPSVKAATARISASSKSVYVGDSVTITATYTAAAWNLTISGNGVTTAKYADVTADAENATKTASVKLNTSKAGTYTVKLTGDITDGTTGNTTNINTSVTVTVKEKPVETPKQTSTNNSSANTATTSATTTSTKENNSTVKSSNDANKKTTNSTNINSNNEQSNNIEEATQQSAEEVKEQVSLFGISKLELYALNEKNEKSKIELTPIFDINTFEYKCKVESNVNKIEIVKDANNYDKYLEIIGLDEELKEGENVIILKMKKDDSNLEYKIIVEKEISKDITKEKIEQEENENNSIKKEDTKKESKTYTFLIQYGWLIGITVVLMSVEAGVFVYVIKKKYIKKQENE